MLDLAQSELERRRWMLPAEGRVATSSVSLKSMTTPGSRLERQSRPVRSDLRSTQRPFQEDRAMLSHE